MNKDKKPLSITHPEIAKEAYGWDPKLFLPGSNKKMEWLCVKNHIWKVSINDRVNYKTGCPYCSNQKLLKGFNDLSTTHPELAKEAYGWDPTTVFAGTHKKLGWQCHVGHRWQATGNDRINKKSGCPYCSNRKVLVGFNDLATTHPEKAKEADGWDPTTVIAGSGKRVAWRCSLGHPWHTILVSRIKQDLNCPVCSNRRLLTGFNDLATTHPELAKEAHGWDPTTVMAGTQKKLQWICRSGHIWITRGFERKNGSSCPVCSNRKVFVGFNDLATSHPELAKEADGWDPTTVIAGSESKFRWRCEKGHAWLASIKNRTNHLSGCPYCMNKLLLKGFNDLATTHPELAKEADGWDPTTVFAGTHKKLGWQCHVGHRWGATPSSRSFQNTGCPSCAKSGYDPNKAGYLYFLVQPRWELYQIGITNFPIDRLNTHKRNGFELVELRGPIDGQAAQEIETQLLRFLKFQKAYLSPEHIAGKFDGYSESWTIDSFKVNNLKELIDRASEAGF